MVEYWNVELLGSLSFLILPSTEMNTNKPLSNLRRTHYSIIPVFHYSNVSEAN